MDRGDTRDYRQLFLSDIPMMDVRAPIEFSKGAFPEAINLPVLNDHERELVGTCYKEKGQDEAILLGHSLLSGETKDARIQRWCEFAQKYPAGYLYCFRGGLRSRSTQQAMKEAGMAYPLVLGGYKAMRRFLIDELELNSAKLPFVIVAGPTGVGKTELILDLSGSIDLEGLANHRGSSFGKLPGGQPSQIDFENSLSIAMLKMAGQAVSSVYLEDEGRLIGRCALSEPLKKRMSEAPAVLLETTLEDRIDRGVQDYVVDMFQRYLQLNEGDEEKANILLAEYLNDSLYRIRKRLGGVRYTRLTEVLEGALKAHKATGALSAYRELVAELLQQYYDPMYTYQDQQKTRTILFKGTHQMILEWVGERK